MSAPIAHGGAIAAAVARFGGTPDAWLDLSTGINPCPPDLPVIPAEAWHRLPDRSLVEAACEAARTFYGSGALLPLAVPGTQAAIQLLPRLVGATKRAAVVWPTYGEYERSLAAAGLPVDRLDRPEDVDPDRHGLLVVVNPNNPDGRRYDASLLEDVASRLGASDGLLVVDEAFADAESGAGLVPLVARHDNLIVFRSFGKFFGMAGVRLGFVFTRAERAATMSDWLGPWSVSGPALAVAAVLLRADTRALGAVISERHAGLRRVLETASLQIVGGTNLFVLVRHDNARGLYEHLCRHHILTRPFDYAPTWLRFGLTPNETSEARLATALAAFGKS
ncbi:threonine-phosphate decarboxylase CobD [Ciceribacter sp. L1K22]|uniref:threonine-phosphate decarboxylase CobD n=1 Tax=Ciceribacter sp. L1K22 TaxID=2820275 RepID=UPI001ABE065A|nr:threonine-phosphate decarboxylase CobD [Ciceribacter sp. L1K22]MBO3760538.1 threonine-phosphate decarboxylase [Ciceribacter sp. L1K22]